MTVEKMLNVSVLDPVWLSVWGSVEVSVEDSVWSSVQGSVDAQMFEYNYDC